MGKSINEGQNIRKRKGRCVGGRGEERKRGREEGTKRGRKEDRKRGREKERKRGIISKKV